MFQSTIFFFLKGTSFALLVSCQIQTLASPWSNSVVPKSGVLFTGSLFCLPKSLVYITRCCIGQRYRQRTQRVSCVSSMLAIAITLNGGIRVNVVGSGKGGSLVPAREEAGVCQDRGSSGMDEVWSVHLCRWIRGLKAGFHVAHVSRIKCCWVLVVDRGVRCWLLSSGRRGVSFRCSVALCETGDPLVCPAVLRKEETRMVNRRSFLPRWIIEITFCEQIGVSCGRLIIEKTWQTASAVMEKLLKVL